MAISDIRKRAQDTKAPWQTCATCDLLAKLPRREAASLRELLADDEVRYQWLADQLEDDGTPVDRQSLSRHARGRCSAREKLRSAK